MRRSCGGALRTRSSSRVTTSCALLGVVVERPAGRLVTTWTEGQARAFQLVHVLLHELGHHHDRMTTRSQQNAARGERLAEEYARRSKARVRDDLERFGL